MSEEEKYNVDNVLVQLQPTYPSHATMEAQERKENDIGTSLAIVMSPVYVWQRRGVKRQTIDDLYQKGFSKISEFYHTENDKEILKKVIKRKIDKENEDAKKWEEKTGGEAQRSLAELFKKYSRELGIEDLFSPPDK